MMNLLTATIFASLFLGILGQTASPLDIYRENKLYASRSRVSGKCAISAETCISEEAQSSKDLCVAAEKAQTCARTESGCTVEEYNIVKDIACTCNAEFEAFIGLSNLQVPDKCLAKATTCNNGQSPSDFLYMQLFCDLIKQEKTCLRSNESCTEETYNTWKDYTCKQYCNGSIRGAQYSLPVVILLAVLCILKV